VKVIVCKRRVWVVLVVPEVDLGQVVHHVVVVVVGLVGILFVDVCIGSACFLLASFVGEGAGGSQFALA
jgi:hypothetical protein